MEIRTDLPAKDSYLKDVYELIRHLETLDFNKELINYFEPAYPQEALNAECYVYVRMKDIKDKQQFKAIISLLGGKIYDQYPNESFWFSL